MSQGKKVTESMLEMFQRCEFTREQWFSLKQKCNDEGILFLSTPQNQTDLDLLLDIGIPAIKVGSDDFTNLPLLKSYSRTGLPMIVSCGMADLAEVHIALDTLGTIDGYPTVLLLCTSEYPTPPSAVNIRKLLTLSQAFPNVPLGLSDHSQGNVASVLAVGYGACFFEKHFTLDKDLPGPDHWFSEDPDSLKQWCQSIRTSYEMLGSPVVRPTNEELKMREIARRSIVAIKDIPEGVFLDETYIGLRRPGSGLQPNLLPLVLSKKSSRSIEKGTLLEWSDFINGS
ncbi:N,N'-diacetyllegionaminic acid synthase [compost metagenome]